MSALEPGRLYMAKVEGASERLLFVETGGWADDMDGTVWNPDCITDARPLIVLGLGGQNVGNLVSDLRVAHRRTSNAGLALIADQIESQTKPERIPEPGLWGVVEAGSKHGGVGRRVYMHGADHKWGNIRTGTTRWDELIDPSPIREGVSE